VSGPIVPVTTYRPAVQQTVVRQRTIQAPPRIVHRAPVVVDQPCPAGTTQQANGTCLSAPRTVHAPAPIVIPQSCPSGTTDLGNGTCQEPAKTIVGQAPIVVPAACPHGTTDLGNGTCQEPAKTVIGAAPIVVNQACPSGTIDLGNGTCEAPARIVEAAPVFVPAPAPVCPTGSYLSEGACLSTFESGHSVPDTIVTGGEYCYGNGKAIYDGHGKKIKGKSHNGHTCKSGH